MKMISLWLIEISILMLTMDVGNVNVQGIKGNQKSDIKRKTGNDEDFDAILLFLKTGMILL